MGDGLRPVKAPMVTLIVLGLAFAAASAASVLAREEVPEQAVSDGKTWVAVPAQSLEVPAGSPLDLSALVPAGLAHRGPLRSQGEHLLFADGSPARLHCALLNASTFQRPEFPTHKEADALAVQLRRAGYGLIRQQFIDFRLTRGAAIDVSIDPEQLDRFFYLLYALKRNGIGWAVDILSAQGRGVRGEAWGPVSPDDLRVRMHIDPAARMLWLRLVDAVFARVNPYTGLSTLADPALMVVNGANENSFGFSATAVQPFPTGFDVPFDRWVRSRFATPQALARALPDASPAEQEGSQPIALPNSWRSEGPRSALLLRFAAAREADTARWMAAALAARGYRGMTLSGGDVNPISTGESRAALPAVEIHAYGGEVKSARGVSSLPSVTTPQGQGNWLPALTTRWYGRPILVTEYAMPYPAPYRYEAALFVPSLASFQGFGAICASTSSPIELAVPVPGSPQALRPLRPFGIGFDPSLRVQEMLAAMLFVRSDVAAGTQGVALPVGDAAFERPGSAILPGAISRLALLARFGLVPPGEQLPLGTVALPSGPVPIGEAVARLRSAGILSFDNETDPTRWRFQTSTRELTVDGRAGRVLVRTPRTEAVSSIGPDGGIALGVLTVERINAGALVAATALDGLPLQRSRRVLLLMTGDVRNSGLLLRAAGTGRYEHDGWGQLPMLMRRVQATVSLRHEAGSEGRLTVLSLRGVPLAPARLIPVDGDKPVKISLDTAAIINNPTTFFMLDFAR